MTHARKFHIGSVLRIAFSVFVLLLGLAFHISSFAIQLALVTGVGFNGTIISWDAQEGVIGYNIYYEHSYIATVVGEEVYEPEFSGQYKIVAFDGNGNFSPIKESVNDAAMDTNEVYVELNGQTPSTPLNVTGTIYSTSAGEIYWDRTITDTLSYRISLNGEFLGTTEGNSYWVDSLVANEENVLTVSSLNSNGLASDAIELIFDTRTSTFPADINVSDNRGTTEELEAPRNASIRIYSSTTAELFWDRAPASMQIESIEVFRNNEFIGSSEGNSFYDDNRTPGSFYTYAIVAVDVNGRRSEATIINPALFEHDKNNAVLGLLEQLSNIAETTPHDRWLPLFINLNLLDPSHSSLNRNTEYDSLFENLVLTFIEAEEGSGYINSVRLYDCQSGSLAITEINANAAAETQINFNNCSLRPNFHLHGTFSHTDTLGDGIIMRYENLVIHSEDLETYMDGGVWRLSRTNRETYEYHDFHYVIENRGETENQNISTDVTLNQQIIRFREDSPSHQFSTNIIANAPWTNGQSIFVTTDSVFSKPSVSLIDNVYSTGLLSIKFENGDHLTWSAHTSQISTWNAELLTADGSINISGSWNEAIRLPFYNPETPWGL